MYRVNLTYRKTLITPDEVIAKIASSHTLDPRRILAAIEIAEERIIRNALCRNFYEELICEKNKEVTADNIAAIQAEITSSLNAEEAAKVVEGDIVNSESYLTDNNKNLWRRYLWKLTAEAVYYVALPDNYAKLTASGIQKANPEIGLAGGGDGKSVGISIADLKALRGISLNDRIDTLREAMHEWLCDKKTDYPNYCKACDCNSDGVAYSRKSSIVMDLYDNPTDENGCPEKSCDTECYDSENEYPCD